MKHKDVGKKMWVFSRTIYALIVWVSLMCFLLAGCEEMSLLGEIRKRIEALEMTEPYIKLTASDASTGDLYGHRVAVDSTGKVIAVGAPHDGENGSDSGAVYVYTGVEFEDETKLIASDGVSNDSFGFSLDISADGSTIAVGAPLHSNIGAVYVYRGSEYQNEIILEPSDGITGADFGADVSVSSDGSVVLSGADGDHMNGDYAGAAYVYHGSLWQTEQKLTASNGSAYDLFGSSLSMTPDASIGVIGAQGRNDEGSVYVYTGDLWDTETSLSPETLTLGDDFGFKVSISGDGTRIAASAVQRNGVGSVFVLEESGTESEIVPPGSMNGQGFGSSLAMSDDHVFIGMEAIDTPGLVYRYGQQNSTWKLSKTFTANDLSAGENFGIGIASTPDGKIVVVGADSHEGTGAVFVFEN